MLSLGISDIYSENRMQHITLLAKFRGASKLQLLASVVATEL
jgi:hypothetical protein